MASSNDHPTVGREPLRTMVLGEGFGGHGSSYLRAEVAASGVLVVSGHEAAPMCEAMGEDLTTEVWLSLAPAWKDELLLRVLAERFTTSRELLDYLNSHGIAASVRSA